MKYPLKKPLTIGEGKLDSLTLRDHTTAADYLSFDKRGGVAQRIALIASLSGTDEAVIERLGGADYLALSKFADDLLTADENEATTENAPQTPAQEAAQKK